MGIALGNNLRQGTGRVDHIVVALIEAVLHYGLGTVGSLVGRARLVGVGRVLLSLHELLLGWHYTCI